MQTKRKARSSYVAPSKQNPSELPRLLLFAARVLIIGIAVSFLLWRCQFSVDLTDEPAYLALGFKLMALGDRPYVDEIFIGPKNFHLLNFLFVRPLLPYSVMALRMAAVVLYASILLWFTWVSFQRRLGILGALAFLCCLWIDRFNMPTWSHNWWCRNFLLLHQGFLLLALAPSQKKKMLWFGLAGLCFGVCILAYNTLAPAFVVTFFALAWTLPNARNVLRNYFLSCAAPLAMYVAYLIFSGLGYDWIDAWQATSSLSIYARPFLSGKLYPVVDALVSSSWWLVVLIAVILGKSEPHRSTKLFAVVGICALLIFRFAFGGEMKFMLESTCALTLGSVGLLVANSRNFRRTTPAFLILAVAGFSTCLIMGVSSVNRAGALFWAAPALWIPFLGYFLNASSVVSNRVAKFAGPAVFGLWLTLIGVSALQVQTRSSYEDVPPEDCVKKVSVPPFKGLYTSERRAFLIEKLAEITSQRQFVLAHISIPGIFLFSNTRASTDSIFEDLAAPQFLQKRSLTRMSERHRYPKVVVVAKTHPWSWGRAPRSLSYLSSDPIGRYIECVAGRTIVDFEEFVAYETRPDRLEPCVELSIVDRSPVHAE